MNILVTEILACLAAAAFLSLFAGWAIRSALANKELKAANTTWESRQSELELQYKQDTEQLEDKIERLNVESKQLKSQNDAISESLRENEISVHKARADAIELNRQQADTQERLQRIIAQKDEELKAYRDAGSVAPGLASADLADTELSDTDHDVTEARMATLSAKREAWERERQRLIDNMGDDQATVVIDPADVPNAQYDETVRISDQQQRELQARARQKGDRQTGALDDADKTLTLDNDQTLSLDPQGQNKPIDRPPNDLTDDDQ